MSRILLAVAAMVVGLAWWPVNAQERDSRLATEINSGTVGVISGGITGTYVRIAADLAAVLDDGNNLRILPFVGKGSVQNIADMLYLKGIDIGIVQSDVLEYAKSEGLFGNIENRIRYITKLYNEEFHLVAGEGVNTVQDLAGKKVNFGIEGSGTHMTSSVVFKALGVEVEATALDTDLALEKLKSGEIAAAIFVAGKPTRAFADIRPEDGLHLVPIEYAGKLRETYLPSSFDDGDYPGLVPPGQSVNTIAVGAVMAVFNWAENNDRYRKVAKFVDAFFTNFEAFQRPPRHQKWKEVNLSAKLPGWVRMKAAEDWLAQHATVSANDLVNSFKTFLAENRITVDSAGVPIDQREELFRQFILWQRDRQ
jgi:TRAP transporter TAXI family solute receptor